MAEATLVFDGDDLDSQTGFKGDVDADIDGCEDEYSDDAAAHKKSDDIDFILDNSNYSQIDGSEDEDDDRESDNEYQAADTGRKRKRADTGTRKQKHRTKRSLSSNGAQAVTSYAFNLEESAGVLQGPPPRASGTFGRYDQKKGHSMAAYNRKVTVTPDSIDALMLEMREKGFSDQQISGKLAKDCGVVYNVKSISTRIMRIRLAQTENTDFLLKEGSKEWQFEDDTTLLQAYALADIEVNYEIERTRAWRFRKVSEYMRRLNKDALFSANACRERYNALIEGKARIPSEVDDDPEARRAEMAARRRECEKARLEEETEKEAQAALKKKRKQEAAAQSAQKAEELANKRMAKEADKAERVKQKAEKAQERAQRALEIQQKQQANSSRVKGQTAVATDSATSQKTVAPTKKPTVPFSRNTPDPRSSLSLPDLRNLCVARGLKVNGKTEEMLLSDIQDAEHKWKLYKLKEMCSSKGLPTSGTKALLRHRLALSSVNEFALSDL